MRTPFVGQDVIFQETDGLGGMTYSVAKIVCVKEHGCVNQSGLVNLHVFAPDNSRIDRQIDDVLPVDTNAEGVRGDHQSRRWNLLESQMFWKDTTPKPESHE